MRCVILDLWDTLVDWPAEEGAALRRELARHVPVGPAEFDRLWSASYRASQTGPLADVYRAMGVPDEHVVRPRQRMDAAEGVLPAVGVHLLAEHFEQQRTRRRGRSRRCWPLLFVRWRLRES